MLSPTVSVVPPEGSTSPEITTRRRGLSYLRSLSSHSAAAATPDQPRSSPRSFFQRAGSYNNETKAKPTPTPTLAPATGRRRSASRPNEPTSRPCERPVLTRVLSAGNSPSPSPAPPTDGNSSSEDTRPTRTQERLQDTESPAVTTSGTMARSSRPSTPRRVTDSAVPSAADTSRAQSNGGPRHSSSAISNGVAASNGVVAPLRATGDDKEEKAKPPMIRLFPHQDVRGNGRQSLNFSPISRILPSENAIIRVGRYSEREGLPVANPTVPSDAPVGFKSKVVSRKHCEFSFVDGQWHIRDVSSSSGTFLNHIRLSQPNQESRLFPVKDGDIVQLGIDFRGGEEMIFRCVKIRIECNRSWQKKPNSFNKSRQAQLLGLTKDQPSAGQQNSGECSICLGGVLPCQSLFVAPCAHVWHYKCIRPMLEGRQSQYPSFQCPNCRAWADLEADVDMAEEDMDAWMENGADTDDHIDNDQGTSQDGIENDAATTPPTTNSDSTGERVSITSDATPVAAQSKDTASPTTPTGNLLSRRTVGFTGVKDSSSVNSIPIPARPNQEEIQNELTRQQTATSASSGDQIIAGEGPLTPRNNAGPFVFDGSGGTGTGDNRRRTLFVPGLFEVTENRAT